MFAKRQLTLSLGRGPPDNLFRKGDMPLGGCRRSAIAATIGSGAMLIGRGILLWGPSGAGGHDAGIAERSAKVLRIYRRRPQW